MMEVIRNAVIGSLFRRLGEKWQEIGALHSSQYAFQSGKATEGPLRIFLGVTQDAYLNRGHYTVSNMMYPKHMTQWNTL
jgi:hypothetical protein